MNTNYELDCSTGKMKMERDLNEIFWLFANQVSLDDDNNDDNNKDDFLLKKDLYAQEMVTVQISIFV